MANAKTAKTAPTATTVNNAKTAPTAPTVGTKSRPKVAVRMQQALAVKVTQQATPQQIIAAWVKAGHGTPTTCPTSGMLIFKYGTNAPQHFFINAGSTLIFNHTLAPTGKVFSGLRHTLWVHRLITRVTGLHM
jgi:hypothetical protein